MLKKAVFPIAGLGTRFLPATKASAKEMLPVVHKPLIQYAVEEAYAAGIRQMIFVTGRTKRSIEDHFDTAYELESELEAAGKKELLALARSIAPADMTCVYVRQPRALGLGHAVLCAAQHVTAGPLRCATPLCAKATPPALVADATLARQQLGWAPQFPELETIVAHAWAWEQKSLSLHVSQ